MIGFKGKCWRTEAVPCTISLKEIKGLAGAGQAGMTISLNKRTYQDQYIAGKASKYHTDLKGSFGGSSRGFEGKYELLPERLPRGGKEVRRTGKRPLYNEHCRGGDTDSLPEMELKRGPSCNYKLSIFPSSKAELGMGAVSLPLLPEVFQTKKNFRVIGGVVIITLQQGGESILKGGTTIAL